MESSIILMYITNVSGHHSVTLSIEKAIHAANPRLKVLNMNGFGYTHPIMEKVIHVLYMNVIKKMPSIWNFLYDNPKVADKINNVKESVYKKNSIKIKKLVESESCKAVICSQAFPCGMVADYKRHYSSGLKLIAVVTDFIPHSYWVYDEIDYYVVGSQEAKETLLKKGVKEEKIKFFGIPIDSKFAEQLDKNKVASELNIILDRPVVLIMGGGHGLGPIKKLIMGLDKTAINAQFLVVAGINKKLFKSLSKAKFKNKVKVYGYIDYVDKLMTLSDVLITKPGGVTTAEALAKRLPMFIIKPLPGQEQNNTNFLLNNGLAKKNDSIEDAIKNLSLILSNPEKISEIKEKMSALSKPNSSAKITELILNLC